MFRADEEIMNTATVAGFFAGLLIGAGAMALLAPHSGKKTRRQIRRKVKAVRKQTTGTIEGGMAQARTKALDMSTSILEQTEALQQRGHDALDEGMERIAKVTGL